MTYRLAIFDLDDTLAPSKSRVDRSIVDLLAALTSVADVAIISGGRFEQFDTQLLSSVDDEAALARFHVLPTCGTRYLVREAGAWREVYSEPLTDDEQQRAAVALEECARGLGLWEPDTWGERIELRGSQVTFSALGQEAPVDAKKAWDPDGRKKEQLRACCADRLPDLEVRSGGSTSVDITRRGIDKAYGVHKLLDALALAPEQAVFFGDRLDEGGNDFPVIATGVPCVAVDGWEDTPAKVRTAVPEAFVGQA
jgi:HAD superfamily hydrolase (TIGR01484 family)